VRPRASRLAGSAAALLLALSAFVTAQSDRRAEPPDEGRLLNRALPDVTLTTADGAHRRLSEVGRGRPLLLAFVFTRCGGVCSPFLRSWRAADSAVSRLTAFHRLVLSFDSRDSAADMAALAEHVGAERDADWTFAVAAPADVRRLVDATGFWYDWNEASQQFDHPAMVAGIRDGRLVRLLVGGVVSSRRLDELVREVSGEFVASYPLPSRRIRFRCLQFDESTGRVTLDWGFMFLLVPIASTGLTTLVMFAAGAQARRRASAVR
jgi:cytochrome oxidase Cu insertion factor (SCO1/SenC/PrrC family)